MTTFSSKSRKMNGFPAGTAALTITATAALDGATGTPPATTLSPPAIASPAGGAGGSGGRGGTSTYTVVTDFRPVTDAELVDPDPGDWLMYRRTLDGRQRRVLAYIAVEAAGAPRS